MKLAITVYMVPERKPLEQRVLLYEKIWYDLRSRDGHVVAEKYADLNNWWLNDDDPHHLWEWENQMFSVLSKACHIK